LLQTTIARGRRGTAMPAWAREAGGPLDADDMRAVVAYLRRWPRPR
jgi:mono/diheme cytochrome c family protein